RRTLLGLLAGLLGALFVPLLVVPFDPDLESTGGLLVAQTLFSAVLVFAALRIASSEPAAAAGNAAALLGLRRFRPSAFGWMALGLFSYYVFAVLYGALIVQPEQEDIARDLGLDTGPLAAVAVVLLIVGIAPVAEEVFFRGMLFGGLRRRLPTIAAALISAAVFGALHAPTGVSTVPPLIAFGFVLALLYERTGSLGPPIVAHAINNALALAVTA
ncbi:MAG: lysostaphin resistance A-like protein, partial [Solirubrobacterales bacterium]